MFNLFFNKSKLNSLCYLLIIFTFIVSCGSGDKPSDETTYYKKQNVIENKLELTIEASGIIEAISSVEIKSYILKT